MSLKHVNLCSLCEVALLVFYFLANFEILTKSIITFTAFLWSFIIAALAKDEVLTKFSS